MASFALQESVPSKKGERARFLREVAEDLRRKDRQKLAKLREDIERVRKQRRAALRDVRSQCRAGRRALRDQVHSYREQERARINKQVEEMRAAAQLTCAMKREAVRDTAAQKEAKARRELAAERQLQRDLRAADQWQRQKLRALPSIPHERRKESDDEVRQNVDPSLWPVWERVKRSIKGTARMSRTEAFLHWVEENPGDAVALQQQAADAEIKRLVKEQRAAEREAKRRRARTYKPSKAELAAYLEGVPF